MHIRVGSNNYVLVRICRDPLACPVENGVARAVVKGDYHIVKLACGEVMDRICVIHGAVRVNVDLVNKVAIAESTCLGACAEILVEGIPVIVISSYEREIKPRLLHTNELLYRNREFLVGSIGTALLHPIPDSCALGDIAKTEDVSDILSVLVVNDVIVKLHEGIVCRILVLIVINLILDLVGITSLENKQICIVSNKLLCIAYHREGIVVIGGI